jgi:spermidine synthase
VSHLFLDRGNGRLALYMHGDLQFDAADESLYHAALGAAADLASARRPGRRLRALILGGGDGLAARELLRREAVGSIDLIERDAAVLALGRGELSELNGRAFADPRLAVHNLDAREALPRARGYDIIVYDLTYPDDAQGASLFSLETMRQLRGALRASGVAALNAVSPEATPAAFVCIGATLDAARLPALAYCVDIPSFAAENYGRWGFYFASRRRLTLREASLAGLSSGLRLPRALSHLAVKPNVKGELLHYLFEGSPLLWQAPLRPLRPRPAGGPRPLMSAADGFALWMQAPRGRRTLERLLRCLPLSQRHQTRETILEWSGHAEALIRQIDLRSFTDEALRRASGLPKAWRRELRRAREIAGELDMRSAFEQAYRVFAVFLIVMLLANLCFPDNLYAKGFSSHYGGGSGSGQGFSFSRSYHSSHRYGGPRGASRGSQGLKFTGSGGRPAFVEDMLALTPDLHLLENGAISYNTRLAGYQALLEPARLRILDGAGAEVMSLLPAQRLVETVRAALSTQRTLIDRAGREHQKWLDWIAWAKPLDLDKTAASEMESLDKLGQAIAAAQEAFAAATPPAAFTPAPDAIRAKEILPGIYLLRAELGSTEFSELLFVKDGGIESRRSLQPPLDLTAEDRFVYVLLQSAFQQGELSLNRALTAWNQAHGGALSSKPVQAPNP